MVPPLPLGSSSPIVGGTLRSSQDYLDFSVPAFPFLGGAVQQLNDFLRNIHFGTYIREGGVGGVQNDAKSFIFGDFS